MANSNLKPFKVPRSCPLISHLLFAGDCLIFTNDSQDNLYKVMNFLQLYAKASCQLINSSKSNFLIHHPIPQAGKDIVFVVTEFS